MKILILLGAMLLVGCDPTEKTDAQVATGKLRHSLFVECMGLAAKMPRQSDDGVSDIVDECDSAAAYMSYSMSK